MTGLNINDQRVGVVTGGLVVTVKDVALGGVHKKFTIPVHVWENQEELRMKI